MKSLDSLTKLALKDAIKAPMSKKYPTSKKTGVADSMKSDTVKMDAQYCCPNCGHCGAKADFQE
jgi:hypothetical protein